MPTFQRNGVQLHFRDLGSGLPFVFQHGLGASLHQTFALFPPVAGVRCLGWDCRGHNRSDLGPPDAIGFDAFGDDLVALLDHLRIDQAVVGGISMGAGIALNVAVRHPSRVKALVLSRPAWEQHPNPFNVQIFCRIAELIVLHGPSEGRGVFRASPEFQRIEADFPDVAKSLENQFSNPRPLEIAEVLRRIPVDVPQRHAEDLQRIRVPTIVLANRRDPVHPFEYGQRLAGAIPGAEFCELTPKSTSVTAHETEFREYVGGFLRRHFQLP